MPWRKVFRGYFYPLQWILQVENRFRKSPKNLQSIDLLVNNAGLALGLDKSYEADFEIG
ncbi:hypothetical protein SAG0110_01745 [Streptococcus agalactiae BSU167]|nr:hypothetical protein SAG0110_01745 [Streptococcus agalactiae BSU167]